MLVEPDDLTDVQIAALADAMQDLSEERALGAAADYVLQGGEHPDVQLAQTITFSQAFAFENDSFGGHTQETPSVQPSLSSRDDPRALLAPKSRHFKYGECPECHCARHLHVFTTGPCKGRIVHMCNNWKKYSEVTFKRLCWEHEFLTPAEIQDLPDSWKRYLKNFQ